MNFSEEGTIVDTVNEILNDLPETIPIPASPDDELDENESYDENTDLFDVDELMNIGIANRDDNVEQEMEEELQRMRNDCVSETSRKAYTSGITSFIAWLYDSRHKDMMSGSWLTSIDSLVESLSMSERKKAIKKFVKNRINSNSFLGLSLKFDLFKP